MVRKAPNANPDLPAKPKRPMNAYMFWLNQNRESIRKQHPTLGISELGKKAGEMWRELKNKKPYEEQAQRDKLRYLQEMQRWEADNGPDSRGNKRARAPSAEGSDAGKRMKMDSAEKKKKKKPIPAADKKKKKAVPGADKKKKKSIPGADKKKKKSIPGADKKKKKSVPGADKKKKKSVPGAGRR